MLPFGTILFTPLFGYIIDFKGKGATLMVLGSIILVATHLLFAMSTITPWVPMFMLGVALGCGGLAQFVDFGVQVFDLARQGVDVLFAGQVERGRNRLHAA